MNRQIAAAWSQPSLTPLMCIGATLGAYLLARRLQKLCGGSALANPVLIAILMVGLVVTAARVSYASYFAGAQFINFLLGPVTVALALPLARNLRHVRGALKGVVLALIAGSTVSIVSGIGLVRLLGGSRSLAFSMAPKSVTTPIAMAVSEQIGGLPSLTAVLAIVGGILAAAIGQDLLSRLRIRDPRIHGFAAGVAGSGVAAAQAVTMGGLAAAFAALGIALNGVLTVLAAPPLASIWR
jgi:putative effector of murein hydrolase